MLQRGKLRPGLRARGELGAEVGWGQALGSSPCPHSPPTLPEREEDDGLDGEELEDGLEGLQELPGGEVEKEQGVEGQADGDVVDEGEVEVATVDAGARAGAGVRAGPTSRALPAVPAWAPRVTQTCTLPAGSGRGGRAQQPGSWGALAGGPCRESQYSSKDVAFLPTMHPHCPSFPVHLDVA